MEFSAHFINSLHNVIAGLYFAPNRAILYLGTSNKVLFSAFLHNLFPATSNPQGRKGLVRKVTKLNLDSPQKIHFIGIGGISMSAIAELLHSKGFTVSGSDDKKSRHTERLEALGVEIMYGNRTDNIRNDFDLIVYTAAIRKDNPEFQAACASGIPMFTRAELLGQIMLAYNDAVGIAGTHGKTTTTSMLSLIQLDAGFDPTILVGGDLPDIEGNLRMGNSSHLVMEACEYTNSFLHFFPKHAIILNIEADHLDFFKDLDDIRCSFRKYMELLPEGGQLVINGKIDHLSTLTNGLSCNVVTFGVSADDSAAFDYTATSIVFDNLGRASFEIFCKGSFLSSIQLAVPGVHNVENALAAIAMGHSLGADMSACRSALSRFTGTKRRFELKGTLGGITIIDDYAHHPAEIRAALTSARSYGTHRVVCVFQPHTYTRTRALLPDFADALTLADLIVLPDIYPAREEDPGDISSRDLESLLRQKGKDVYYFSSFDEIESFLRKVCLDGDLLITMGAGDVVNIGESLLSQ